MSVKHLGYAALIASTAVVFAIGSAATGQAKAMKKVAAPPPPYICNMIYKPVCAVKGGIEQTYSSACWAAKDGAKILYEGACKVEKAKKRPAMKKKSKKKM